MVDFILAPSGRSDQEIQREIDEYEEILQCLRDDVRQNPDVASEAEGQMQMSRACLILLRQELDRNWADRAQREQEVQRERLLREANLNQENRSLKEQNLHLQMAMLPAARIMSNAVRLNAHLDSTRILIGEVWSSCNSLQCAVVLRTKNDVPAAQVKDKTDQLLGQLSSLQALMHNLRVEIRAVKHENEQEFERLIGGLKKMNSAYDRCFYQLQSIENGEVTKDKMSAIRAEFCDLNASIDSFPAIQGQDAVHQLMHNFTTNMAIGNESIHTTAAEFL